VEWLNRHEERRQNPRFPVRLPLDYSETPGILRGALVADISEVGLRILSVHPIQIGTELKIRIYVSKEEFSLDSIEGSGKIIWRTLHQETEWKGFQYGLHITEMASDDRERLGQLLKFNREGGPSTAGRVQ
jgi:hypothetical protein